MTKESLEQLLVDYGVSFTSALADRLLEEFNPGICENAISRQAVLDIIEKEQFKGDAISEIQKLPPVISSPIRPTEPCEDVKPISYQDCANAMMKMWIENVVTDGEYNRIMDKLNAWHMGRKDIGVVNERTN